MSRLVALRQANFFISTSFKLKLFSLKPLGFAHATAPSALLCAIWLRHCRNHACGMTEPQKAPNAWADVKCEVLSASLTGLV